ncbi:hypothetical protein DXG01_013631 [Tephrocybe rancida]|nr:hypothetical protein DXG01_013631 [Tephrocybe rancida]
MVPGWFKPCYFIKGGSDFPSLVSANYKTLPAYPNGHRALDARVVRLLRLSGGAGAPPASAYYELVRKGAIVELLEELHRIYGPVVRIGPEELHFNDPRAFEDIYSVGSKLTKPQYYYQAFNTESTFGYIDVREAKQRKDVMRPLFSRKAILQLEGVIQSSIDQLIAALLSYSPSSPANLQSGYHSTSMEIITTYCFARSYGVVSFPHFEHPTIRAISSIKLIPLIMQHFPFTVPLIKGMPRWLARKLGSVSRAYAMFANDLASQIDALLEDSTGLERAEHQIIYHHLLNTEGGRPSRSSLIDEARSMVIAGTETVGNTCAVGTFRILSDPGVYARLVKELHQAWPDVEARVGFETLEKLPYLTAVIKESLRLSHGVVSPLPRVVHLPTDIGGAAVPANTIVSMGATFMHYNPEVFSDPFKFRPERWLDKDASHLHEMEQHLVPFSKGPRSCLGINLAWAELYLILANVFRKIDMEIYDTTAEDFKFKAYFTPKNRGKPLRVRVRGKKE